MKFAARTDPGRCRLQNDDGVLVDATIGLLAVADGLGGYSGGSIASRLALDCIRAYVNKGVCDRSAIRHPEGLLKNALRAANERIWQKSREDTTCREMASTIVAALFREGCVHIAQLGDTRAYMLRREHGIVRLTEDHSLVQEMLSEGKLTPRQAKNHRLRNVLTHCLGDGQCAEPGITTITLAREDILLLCSDGLTKMLEDEEILAVVHGANWDVSAGCAMLIDLANHRGGKDNISVVLATHIEC